MATALAIPGHLLAAQDESLGYPAADYLDRQTEYTSWFERNSFGRLLPVTFHAVNKKWVGGEVVVDYETRVSECLTFHFSYFIY